MSSNFEEGARALDEHYRIERRNRRIAELKHQRLLTHNREAHEAIDAELAALTRPAMRKAVPISHTKPQQLKSVAIPSEIAAQLEPAAKRMGVNMSELSIGILKQWAAVQGRIAKQRARGSAIGLELHTITTEIIRGA